MLQTPKPLNLELASDYKKSLMKNYLFLFFVFFYSFLSFAQNFTKSSSYLQTDFFYGKLIEHDKKLKNAIQNNPYGFMLSWNTKNTENSTFNTLYNFPERGYTFLYENFNSTVLGEAYGAYRHYTYNLTPKKNHQLNLTSAFGLAYTTKPYNRIRNNQNVAFGSKLLVSAYLKLQYFTFFTNTNFGLRAGLSLIHFSNISFKSPNLGINTVAFNLGVNYKLKALKIPISNNIDSENKIASKVHYNLILRGGYNESLEIDSGLFPFYTVTFYASKNINRYSTITTGIDFFDATFLKNYIEDINKNEGKTYNENNYRRAGIFIGHELIQNNFAFISQIGYTFYYPFPYVSRVYERFGFKYNISKHFFSEITMKVNLFRAESLEFGIGYKF